jgi:pimeloyl-ACP methyl ester carboxylesterase
MNTGIDSGSDNRLIRIRTDDVELEGFLVIPGNAIGLVVFAHGSGSSRHSSRNKYVASLLHTAGLGTLLFDLLTSEEEAIDMRTRQLRFDIPMLARRVAGVTDWLRTNPLTQRFPIGYFGASTGAAAALIAASRHPHSVHAVVSRGGRPDLADDALPHVTAATLLIVGGDDLPVLEMNWEAYRQLRCEKRLEIIPGATHLFEEPGALEMAAQLARDWFREHLVKKAHQFTD